uniref:Carbonyl reductase 1 n=1 Tax=Hucho hucho TaxID=62062 RepID=A0A4W5NZQ3_9TELE
SSTVALVTGSTRGLELAIVQALCQAFKWDVYLSAWDVKRGAMVVEDLQWGGLKPRLLQLDITDPANILAAWQHFMKEYGGLDVLINNARINTFSKPNSSPQETCAMSFFLSMCVLRTSRPFSNDIAEEELVALKCFVAEAKAGDHISKGWPNSGDGLSKIGLMALRDTPERIQLNPCCLGWVKSDISYTNGTRTPAEVLDTPVHLITGAVKYVVLQGQP